MFHAPFIRTNTLLDSVQQGRVINDLERSRIAVSLLLDVQHEDQHHHDHDDHQDGESDGDEHDGRRVSAVLSEEVVVADADGLLLIAGSLSGLAVGIALIVLEERIALHSHESFLALASSRSVHLVRARALARAHLALLVHRTLLLALAAPESALAVRAARRRVESRVAVALARPEMPVQTLPVPVAALARLAARAEVALRAGVAHARRTPALVADALSRAAQSVIARSVVAGLALLAVGAEEAGQTGRAGRGRVEALAADLADAVGAVHRDLQRRGVGLGLGVEVEHRDVVEAVRAVLRVVVRQLDLRAVVRLRRVRPEVVVHARVRRRRHEQHHVRLVLAQARHRHLHRRVGRLVQVEERFDAARERHQRASARLVGLQHERSCA